MLSWDRVGSGCWAVNLDGSDARRPALPRLEVRASAARVWTATCQLPGGARQRVASGMLEAQEFAIDEARLALGPEYRRLLDELRETL